MPSDVSFPELEETTLAAWQAERVFERSVSARAGGRPYVFYDGPPFATGLPHYGHILTSYIKDVVPRYFTMRGYHVPRRWGWDCHGLPVEFEVEKVLGLRSRAEIVEYGVDRFNEACRGLVLRYASDWRTIVERLGRWVDFDHAYRTMDQDYMESVLWCFKRLHELGLVYKGRKVIAFCVRCQTPLSNFEARLDDAFRLRTDPAITVRFALEGGQGDVLAWTTTPWTLPSNVALAVHPDLEYVRYERDGASVWLAAAALGRYAHELDGYTERERVPGSALIGRRYRPLFPYFADTPNAFVVAAASYVTAEDGTGIVHIAPAFGEEDARVGEELGIAGPNPVRDDGTFDERVTDFAGLAVFDANEPIIRHLKQAGAVVRHDTYDHNYPHCWRCDTPLIYRSLDTWFVRVSAVKDRMLARNRDIHWVPEHIRDGRFGNWLENARDWAVSRNRFWGSPIPVWECDGCHAVEVLGSLAEIAQRSGKPAPDLHRPDIDAVTFPCAACGGVMRRVPDVLDCWFESGSMPYAQVHYPFEHQREFEASFPGDFIVEYVAQTRGWFYTLVVLSTALFDRAPFRNAVCHGVILAEDGRKMSKRLQNYPDPLDLVGEHGSDALRVALLSSGAVAGNDIRFNPASVRDAVRRFCLPVWNSLHYFSTYASIDRFVPAGTLPAMSRLDRYMLSETESLRADVEAAMDAYDFAAAYRRIEEYVGQLSTWYIRLTRARLWRSGLDDEKRTTYEVLYASLTTLARVMAPFLPFLADAVHRHLGHAESVHLADWPVPVPAWQDAAIVAEMRRLQAVVRLARVIRERNNVKLRQPLGRMILAGVGEEAVGLNRDLLLDELNVKAIEVRADVGEYAAPEIALDVARLGKRLRQQLGAVRAAVGAGAYAIDAGGNLQAAGVTIAPDEFSFRYSPRAGGIDVAAEGNLVVVLDLTVDESLRREGQARDLNRAIQNLRKRAGLRYEERIVVSVSGGPATADVLHDHGRWLAEQALAVRMGAEPLSDALASDTCPIGDEVAQIALARSPGG